MSDRIIRLFDESADIKRRFARAHAEKMAHVAQLIGRALRDGYKILLFGNGGSATDASHIAAEFVGRYHNDRAPLPAMALATDMAAITCIANDYGFEEIFARQVLAHGRKGDIAIGISTSGRSPNVLRALEAANEGGLLTIALTGRGGEAGKIASLHVRVDEERTARVQEVHATLLHAICELVDEELGA